MPAGPPRYEEPGHHPPPYHIATSMGNPQSPLQQAHLPGYVDELLYYDGVDSFSSTVSIGALSQPPPYSPPPTASLRPLNS
ncbi:hypothetical protein C0Q70_10166 [Pomacea canaliculata]|uniref:Uncharacterized protein n=2 Tax=Pomacea canaliculata TaxID=400727 RepID=A0A2T7PBU6_POMCA|nr:hypothetical protein C0Q70_10166 [Pomacea canaliculata]